MSSAPVPSSRVRVDDIAWKLRDTLFGAGRATAPSSLQSDEQGRNFVQFGDGAARRASLERREQCARHLSQGPGRRGQCRGRSLTQPTQRPLGLKGVSNPLPAEGGTDPEARTRRGRACRCMTRTLGRAVSLLDYEDFARAFAGVAKARAQVLQLPSGPVIAITIAGPGGVVISPDSPVWINLAAALADNGDPHVAVRLLAHRPGTFRLGLRVKRDPDFESRAGAARSRSAHCARASASMRAHWASRCSSPKSSRRRRRVRGVIAVDLDFLYGGTQPVSQTAFAAGPAARQSHERQRWGACPG